MRLFFLFGFFFLEFSFLASAETLVSQITVKGALRDEHISEIRRSLGFSEGDTIDEKSTDLAIKRIGANPLFRNPEITIDPTLSGTRIAVHVEMEPFLDAITLDAPKDLYSMFESRLALLKGQPYNEAHITRTIEDLQEYCSKTGYYQAQIEYALSASQDRGLLLNVKVRSNAAVVVDRIEIRAPSPRLQREIVDVTQLYVGSIFNRSRVLDSLKSWRMNKVAQNFFDASIQIIDEQYLEESNSIRVVIEAQVGSPYQISFSGVTYFSARYLRDKLLHLLSQSQSTDTRLDRIRSQVIDEYRRAGFRDARIEVSSSLDIVINEGQQYWISHLQVDGQSHTHNLMVAQRMRAIMESESRSYTLNTPPAIILDGYLVFGERLISKAKGMVQSELEQKGYSNAKLSGPQIRINQKTALVTLNFNLHLGPQTRVASVDLDAPSNSLRSTLDKCISTKAGDVLVIENLETPRACLEELLWNNGYPYAVANAEILMAQDNNAAAIKFHVKPGPFVRIGKIEIRGTVKTQSRILLSRIATKAGEPFSLVSLAKTRAALFESDIFDRIEIFTETEDESDERRTLVLEVHEKSRTSIELGVGASLEDGPRISFLTGQRNLFGLGLGLRGRLQLNYPALFYRLPLLYPPNVMTALENRFKTESAFVRSLLYTEAKIAVSLEFPLVPFLPWETDAIADFSVNRELKVAYTMGHIGLTFGATLKPASWIRFIPDVEYGFAKFFCADGNNEGSGCGTGHTGPIDHRIEGGESQQVTLRLSTMLDGRDSAIRPSKGFFVDAATDLGLGQAYLTNDISARSIQYLKLQASFNFFTPITRAANWYMSIRLGQIFDFADPSYVPLYKRFYMGGTSSLRGFAEEQVLPADDKDWPATSFSPTDPKVVPLSLGGNFLALFRTEVRFRLGADYDAAIFVDAGELLVSSENFTLDAIAVGTGFGIRYMTPIGPLMLDLGIRVVDGHRSFEAGFLQLFGLHFSIGYV